MKAIIFFILFTMLTIPSVFGQVKIGDNPQNIDPASVLELESSSKVLVITRVNSIEMEAITPRRGGIVYNTDTECINYYDGTQWINLCDAVNFTITNDPIINNRATIEITQTESGYNLEIAKDGILGDNIVDGGIGPDDIQDNSITQDKLAAESVGSSEIRQNAVGSDEIRDGSIAPTDIANFIPGQVLTTDENGIVQWEAADDVFDLTFSKLDTTLTITRSTIPGTSSVNLGALIGSDDQELTFTADNKLQIENGNEIDLSTLNNSGTDNQTISTNNNPGNISILNGNTINLNVNDADANPNNEIQNIQEVLVDGNNAGGLLIKNIGNPVANQDAATKAYVDGAITGVGGAIVSTQPNNNITNNGGAFYNDLDESPTNEIQNIQEVLADGNNAGGLLIKNIGNPVANQDAATKAYVDGAITGVGGTIVSTQPNNNITDNAGAFYDDPDNNPINEIQNIQEVLADGNNAGGLLIKNIGTPVANQDAATKAYVDANAGISTLTNSFILVGNGVNVPAEVAVGGDATINNLGQLTIANGAINSVKIANGTILAEDLNQMGAAVNQVLKWNGTNWGPAIDAGGNAYTGGNGLTLNGNAFDVDNLLGDVTGPTNATLIANNAVTSAKIANATILAEDLNPMGAANNEVLKWNGTNWAPAADAGGTAYTGGAGLTLNGTAFDVDNLLGDVTGPTNATLIANNAVTSAKIANATILAEDLNPMGAANNEVLKWNGTNWAPAADAGGTAYTGGAGLTLNGTAFDVDNLLGDVTGPTNATVIANNAVTSLKIANASILAEDLNPMGAANNEVLKWNGTNWAPAADAGGTAYTGGAGLTLNGTAFDVDNLLGDVTGPTNATLIANNAVTSAKIANATILAEDLNPMGAANNEVLKWNGTNWAPAADAGGTAYTGGAGLTLNGTAFDVDNLLGDVTGPTNATVIANNAVTSLKIANASILAEDLNPMGAANNEVLKWNGTNWAPAADAGGTAYTGGNGLTLNGTAFDVDNLAGQVTGPTSATVIADGSISGGNLGQIIDNSITASDLAPDSVDASEIRIDAVGQSEIETGGVATDEIQNFTIINEDVSPTAAIEGTKIIPNFGGQNITTTGNITGTDITANNDIFVTGTVFRGVNNLHPDYVFQKYFLGNSILNPEYEFTNLSEIEEFVKENNHLPGIKSVAAIKEQGFWDLGEASRINLEKIEELFLHTIEQEKKIKELESSNKNMATEVEALKAQMEEIKKLLLEKTKE